MSKEMITFDPAANQMLPIAKELNIFTAFDRAAAQKPQCGFGSKGVCCRICLQGPCRITPKAPKGICGATDYTIVARNLARMASGGASAHSDHGRHIVMALLHAAEGHLKDYEVKDVVKLNKVAANMGLTVDGKSPNELAKEVALLALEDFKRLDGFGEAEWLVKNLVEQRLECFRANGILPAGINAAIVTQLHQTHEGMDADPVNIIFGALKAALADLDGEWIATELSDILFGTPKPVASEANMGVLEKDLVNIVIHGHNPIMSEIVVKYARLMEDEAKAAGAKGIGLSGICCTGNEVLMRQGVPIVTSFGAQELAIVTGAVDVMVVDVQCIMPGLQTVSKCFDTKLVTTNELAKIPGAYHIPFSEDRAEEAAREVINLAINSFKERAGKEVRIPQIKNKLIAGWSVEALMDLFGFVNKENPISVLTDAIMAGEIKGVAALVGCNNHRTTFDENHLTTVKELLKRDVFVIATGCAAQAFAKEGLMDPAKRAEFCGEGINAFITRLEQAAAGVLTTGLPSTFHMGSCVDNSRTMDLLTRMSKELGVDSRKVPFVASAPEAMSEKAIAIGSWFVSMGVPTHVGVNTPVHGSDLVYGVVTNVAEDVFGGYLLLEDDCAVAAQKLVEKLDERAWRIKVRNAQFVEAEDGELAGK